MATESSMSQEQVILMYKNMENQSVIGTFSAFVPQLVGSVHQRHLDLVHVKTVVDSYKSNNIVHSKELTGMLVEGCPVPTVPQDLQELPLLPPECRLEVVRGNHRLAALQQLAKEGLFTDARVAIKVLSRSE
jgi:hypothetical protein